ncbi:hypothetical protein SAMN05444340_12138 [Citreimonas salinaria]|uniref:Uncharacterized protein n=1 Tax=Citreimonas salinaria TaxID=321339 RepID=A0A1H3N811_9RHOB|nr:hypothetical protein SAMN05444340_12138 [Citreimonas salinaria]
MMSAMLSSGALATVAAAPLPRGDIERASMVSLGVGHGTVPFLVECLREAYPMPVFPLLALQLPSSIRAGLKKSGSENTA